MTIMSDRNKRWVVRDLRRRLRELGCRYVRHCGSHEVWELPNGTSLPPIVGNYGNAVVHVRTLKQFLASRGIEL